MITNQVFFKLQNLPQKMRLWTKTKDGSGGSTAYNGRIFGLGDSHNDDQYIEDYKYLTLEYGKPASGKPLNLTNLCSPPTKGSSGP